MVLPKQTTEKLNSELEQINDLMIDKSFRINKDRW